MKLNDQARRLIERNPEETVLGTGYTLSTMRSDLELRDDVLDSIEGWVDKMRARKKDALENALDADYGEKIQYYRQGEEARLKLETLEEIRDKLMVEQLFLSKLVNQHLRQNYLDNTSHSFGFEVDIGEMDASAVANAVDRSDIMEEDTVKIIEEIDEAMGRAGDVDMAVDLSQVRAEAEELEADDLEAEMESGGVEQQLDTQIEEELEDMEETVSRESEDPQ